MIKSLVLCMFVLGHSAAPAAIYGSDDRRDLFEAPSYADVAKAVAVPISNLFLAQNSDGTTRIEGVDHLDGYLCRDQRFSQQTSIGHCTGFLIGDRYLVTAGHCALPNGIIDNQFAPLCEDFSWYFDYNMKTAKIPSLQSIPPHLLYKCKRILRAETLANQDPNDPLSPPGKDFTLIELERAVDSRIQALKIASTPVAIGDKVYTIGHPFGLPAKFSGFSAVHGISHPNDFEVNLDTQSGNSGGPVFNSRNEVVGILVSGHAVDSFETKANSCAVWNVCSESGDKCQVESKFLDSQRSNYVQKIDVLLPYLPRRLNVTSGLLD